MVVGRRRTEAGRDEIPAEKAGYRLRPAPLPNRGIGSISTTWVRCKVGGDIYAKEKLRMDGRRWRGELRGRLYLRCEGRHARGSVGARRQPHDRYLLACHHPIQECRQRARAPFDVLYVLISQLVSHNQIGPDT